jgi:hypothetical protein
MIAIDGTSIHTMGEPSKYGKLKIQRAVEVLA